MKRLDLFWLDGPGIYDPCEKEPTDVLKCLTSQQKEDITVSAQVGELHRLNIVPFQLLYLGELL